MNYFSSMQFIWPFLCGACCVIAPQLLIRGDYLGGITGICFAAGSAAYAYSLEQESKQ